MIELSMFLAFRTCHVPDNVASTLKDAHLAVFALRLLKMTQKGCKIEFAAHFDGNTSPEISQRMTICRMPNVKCISSFLFLAYVEG